MISGYGFLTATLSPNSQSDDSGTFKNIYGGVDKGGVSSGYGSMNSHTDLQEKWDYWWRIIIGLMQIWIIIYIVEMWVVGLVY